eukprot:g2747.t1
MVLEAIPLKATDHEDDPVMKRHIEAVKHQQKLVEKLDPEVDLCSLLRSKINARDSGGTHGLIRKFKQFKSHGGIDGHSMNITFDGFRDAVHSYGIPATVSQLKALFDIMDIDGSGRINFVEFTKIVLGAEKLGYIGGDMVARDETVTSVDDFLHPDRAARRRHREWYKKEVEAIPQHLNDEVNVLQLLRDKITSREAGGSHMLLRAFKEFREHGAAGHAAFINRDGFARALKSYGIPLDKEEVDAFFATLDINKDGTLHYEEFVKKIMEEEIDPRRRGSVYEYSNIKKEAKNIRRRQSMQAAKVPKVQAVATLPVETIPKVNVHGVKLTKAEMYHVFEKNVKRSAQQDETLLNKVMDEVNSKTNGSWTVDAETFMEALDEWVPKGSRARAQSGEYYPTWSHQLADSIHRASDITTPRSPTTVQRMKRSDSSSTLRSMGSSTRMKRSGSNASIKVMNLSFDSNPPSFMKKTKSYSRLVGRPGGKKLKKIVKREPKHKVLPKKGPLTSSSHMPWLRQEHMQKSLRKRELSKSTKRRPHSRLRKSLTKVLSQDSLRNFDRSSWKDATAIEKDIAKTVGGNWRILNSKFRQEDFTRSGTVGVTQFRDCLKAMNVNFTEEQFIRLCARYEKGSLGRINYSKFISAMLRPKTSKTVSAEEDELLSEIKAPEGPGVDSLKYKIRQSWQTLSRAFRRVDYTRDGKIPSRYFRRVLAQNGIALDEDQFYDILRSCSADHGAVLYNQFLRSYLK